ncbi:MAG: DoxX family protein [Bacteroidetes bacterium]|nr:DoxX family protein [Bacteroidota bacterium]
MKHLTNIGRILFALPFGLMGLNHFLMYSYMEGISTTFIPGGGWTVIMTGLALIAASVSIISKKFIRTSCLLLALLLLIFVLTIHVPGLFSPDHQRFMFALFGLFTNVALMGGALLIAGIYKEKSSET